MTDREKVIEGLRKVETSGCLFIYLDDDCKTCPYLHVNGCVDQVLKDALELLKEQNARMLTPDEYAEWCLGEENRNAKQNTWKPKTPLLIEKRRENGENVMYWLNAPEMVVHIDKEYGKTFIVWNGYPTEEQREKVEWDER